MGFNVKAALLVSLAFIGGMAWLIHHVGAPVAALPSPLAPSGNSGQPGIPTAPPARPEALEYQSPLDRQEAENRAKREPLVLHAERNQPVHLPPLVLPPVAAAHDAAAAPGREIAGTHDDIGRTMPEPRTVADEALTPAPASASADAPSVKPATPVVATPVVAAPVEKPVLPSPTLPTTKSYVVQRGDSVAKIVRTHWNSDDPQLIRAFVDANPKIRARQNRILVGEELVVPDLASMRLAATDSTTPRTPVAPARRPDQKTSEPAPAPRKPADPARQRRDVPPDPRHDKPEAPAVARNEPPSTPAPRTVRTEPDAPRTVRAEPDALRVVSAPPAVVPDPRPAPAIRALPPERPIPSLAASPVVNDTERPGPKSVKKVTGPLAKKLAPAQTAPPRWYTIQPNDSLRNIAKRHLKDERRWREIAALNPALRDADRLAPGSRIKLPPPVRVASR